MSHPSTPSAAPTPPTAPPVIEPGVDPSARVDQSARIDDSASVGPDAVIGPDVIVGPNCAIGAGCELRARAIVCRNTTLGQANVVHPYAVLGGDPQDKAYSDDAPGWLHIGDRNIFREGVTLSRGTGSAPPTRIGSGNFFMAQAHAGHNVQIGDDNVFPNTTMIAGHVRIGDRCVFSGGVSVHQFVIIGDLVMIRGLCPVGMHVPHFVMVAGPNRIGGLNVIGLRRAGVEADERAQIKALHGAVFRDRQARPILDVLDECERTMTLGPHAQRFVAFIRDALSQDPPRNKGLCPGRGKATDSFK